MKRGFRERMKEGEGRRLREVKDGEEKGKGQIRGGRKGK